LVLLLGALGLVGCARNLAPVRAAKDYARALDRGDARAAYSQLTPEAQAQISPEAYEQRLAQEQKVAATYARDVLTSLENDPASLTLESKCAAGLTFFYEDGEWKVGPEALDIYSQASPEDALTTLVRAYRAARFDVLSRLLVTSVGPLELRPRTQQELEKAHKQEDAETVARRLDVLSLALERPELEVLGPRARMSYGVGRSIELVLDKGQWKIEDFDL